MEIMARELPFESVCDIAWFNAVLRALESCNPDSLFEDPIVKHVKANDIDAMLRFFQRNPSFDRRAVAQRTRAFDELLRRRLRECRADTVLHLGAGWDTRPYRMRLSPKLRWVEADLPRLVEKKARTLANEAPTCRLERRGVDLSDAAARKTLLDELDRGSRSVLVLSEGLLQYLPEALVRELALELRARPRFSGWLTDLMSPDGVASITSQAGPLLRRANTWIHFGPAEGPAYFGPLGWQEEAKSRRRGSLGRRIWRALIRSWKAAPSAGGVVSLVPN